MLSAAQDNRDQSLFAMCLTELVVCTFRTEWFNVCLFKRLIQKLFTSILAKNLLHSRSFLNQFFVFRKQHNYVILRGNRKQDQNCLKRDLDLLR